MDFRYLWVSMPLGAGGRAFKSPRPDQQNQSDKGTASLKAGRL